MSHSTCFISGLPVSPSVRPFVAHGARISVCPQPACIPVTCHRRARVNMGLFGLGFAEVGVIAAIGVLMFGPSKITELGRDLGGVAGGIKKASSEFKDAMQESLDEADREIEKKKIVKEAAENQIVDTSASTVSDSMDSDKKDV